MCADHYIATQPFQVALYSALLLIECKQYIMRKSRQQRVFCRRPGSVLEKLELNYLKKFELPLIETRPARLHTPLQRLSPIKQTSLQCECLQRARGTQHARGISTAWSASGRCQLQKNRAQSIKKIEPKVFQNSLCSPAYFIALPFSHRKWIFTELVFMEKRQHDFGFRIFIGLHFYF